MSGGILIIKMYSIVHSTKSKAIDHYSIKNVATSKINLNIEQFPIPFGCNKSFYTPLLVLFIISLEYHN